MPIVRSRAWCIAIPTASCSSSSMPARSIAVSASAAKWSGRGRAGLSRAELAAALDYIRAHAANLGSDPDRRRSAVAVAAAAQGHHEAACGDRARQGHPRAYPRCRSPRPSAITPALVRALRTDKAVFVVLHANHPRELTADARAACARFVDAGIPMLSQSVLLRGVNDDAETLGALMRALVECRIKPYYLHHADLAPGTAHLRTTIAEGQDLMRALHGRTSGLCQPAYVLDIPGGYGKSPIGPNYLMAAGLGDAVDRGFQRAASRLSAAISAANVLRAPSGRGCEIHCSLELVAAIVARPDMAYAAGVEIFGPVRRQEPLAALGASVLAVSRQARLRGMIDVCSSGVQSHAFLRELTPPPKPTIG